MNCAECRELLVTHLEGLLEDAQKRTVVDHLKTCKVCRAEFKGLQTLRQRLVSNGKALAQSDLENEVMNRIVREQNVRLRSAAQAGMGLHLRRLIMKSSMVKVAVAAAVVLVCVGGFFLVSGTRSVALADVLAQVQQITAYMYQMTMTINGKAPTGQSMDQNVEASILIAQGFGMKSSTDMTEPKSGTTRHQEQYVLPKEKAIVMIMPNEKQYVRMDLNETLLEQIHKQTYDPGTMLKQILGCKYESLGRSTVDGVEVEGFQTTDPNYLGGMMGKADVKIWVDVKTRLPVRSEMDMQLEDMQVHGVVHSFQWNCPVTAAEFTPVIPADYTTLPGGPMKMPAMNEEGAIAGLKLFADLFERYPEKLDLMSLTSQMGKGFMSQRDKLKDSDNPALKQIFEGSKDLSKEEITKKVMGIMMPIQGAGMFYMLLTQEKKDPAYYGNVVTPQDADKVLMRWKLSDNQYRVLFGSLHAETVSAETLAELEKDIPKEPQ